MPMTCGVPGPYEQASALDAKALDLHSRGHKERALDKLRGALAAARGVGANDCLVTEWLTVEVCLEELECRRELLETTQHPQSEADKVLALLEVPVAAAATARRRHSSTVALQTAPAEQAWYLAHVVAHYRARRYPESHLQSLKERGVAPIAYDIVFHVAAIALDLIGVVLVVLRHEKQKLIDVLSHAEAVCDLVDEAAALAESRRHSAALLSYDVAMKSMLDQHISRWSNTTGAMAPYISRLAAASTRLGVSLNLTAADIAKHRRDLTKCVAEIDSLRAVATVPGLLRCCALASCSAKEAHVAHFKSCAACHKAVYCSRDHQVADWANHKHACKAARMTKDEQPAAS